MAKKYYVYGLLVVFIQLTLQVCGQNTSELKFKQLSLPEGLSQSCVNSIIQDNRSFLWFGTQDGLNCFDGYDFKVYKNELGNPYSISPGFISCILQSRSGMIYIGTTGGGLNAFNPATGKFQRFQVEPNNNLSIESNEITCLYEDNKGIIWIGTGTAGLQMFSPKSGEFIHFKHEQYNHRTLSSNTVTCITQDDRGVLWIGTDGGGLNSFNTKTARFKAYHKDPHNNESLLSERISCLMYDVEGNLWIGSPDGVCILNKHSLKFSRPEIEKNSDSPFNKEVSCIMQDSKKQLWIGTAGNGLYFQDKKTNLFTHFVQEENKNHTLSNNYINSIFEDKSGGVWIGTFGGGVNFLNQKTSDFKVFSNKNIKSGSVNFPQDVWAIYEDRENNLWLGGFGSGLVKYDLKTHEIETFKNDPKKENSISSNDIITICKDKAGVLLVGTYNNGLNQFIPETKTFKRFQYNIKNERSIGSNNVRILFEDSNGTTWLGTYGGGLNVFNSVNNEFKRYVNDPKRPDGINNNNVMAVSADNNGLIWVGTKGGGVNVLNASNGNFKKYINNPDDIYSLSNNDINCIYCDKHGVIWIGTSGGGLNQYNPSTDNFTNYTEKDGLPNNVIYGVLEDTRGNLWLSTNNGICKFTPPKNASIGMQVKVYDVKDGLPGNEFNFGAWHQSTSGRMYFGSINGVVSFHPDSLNDNEYIPPVYITSFKISGHKEFKLDSSITAKKLIVLDHDQNTFSFEFVGLNYIIPEKNQYACMMEGLNPDWEIKGNRRYANYTNLDPGEYIFRVKASNNDGIWNDKGTYIHIIITPPWYFTIWTYAGAVILFILLIVGYVKWRERSLKQQTKILEKKVTERTRQLKREKDKVEEAYLEIGQKNKEITDSIRYAKRLQEAILPPDKEVKRVLQDSFILYIPKDIVSGDFYFFDHVITKETNGAQEKAIVAVVDCTGHGVPGAFMSIVGNNLLRQAIDEHHRTKPSEILDELNKGLSETLKQTFEESTVKDGMDIALCSLDLNNHILEYAGAFNPLWIIRKNIALDKPINDPNAVYFNKHVLEIKPDKFPVGAFVGEELHPFNNHTIPLQKGDCVYIFSDGYADQFGGPKGKKFKYNQLQMLLIEHMDKPMEEQKHILQKTFEEWKGNAEQLDDILIIGFRVV